MTGILSGTNEVTPSLNDPDSASIILYLLILPPALPVIEAISILEVINKFSWNIPLLNPVEKYLSFGSVVNIPLLDPVSGV